MFEDEIGVFGQSALFEHVLQRPLAPAPARLGSVGEAVAKPLCLAPNLFLPALHLGNLLVEASEGIGALFFELCDLLFIFRQPLAHG